MRKLRNTLLIILILGLTVVFAIDLAKRSSRILIKEAHYDRAKTQEMFEAINKERKEHNLHELAWLDSLSKPADIRAKELYEKMGHERPDGTPFYTVHEDAMGENVARGYNTVTLVMNGFMDSAGHRDAILSEKYHYVACSVYYEEGTYYYVQLFN